jgi:tetratricopeptide (TPR) repeat protein
MASQSGASHDAAFVYGSRYSAHVDQGMYQAALADCEQGLQLKPEDASWLGRRGDVYARLQQTEKALAEFNRAIELEPKNPNSYRSRANFYESQENYQAVVDDYTRMIELEPKNPEWVNNRGVAFNRLRDHVAALADYTKAIELAPTAPLHRSNRAMAYKKLHRTQESLDDVNAALKLSLHEHPHYALCHILIDSGQYLEALEAVDRGIKLIPDSRWIKDARLAVLMRLQRYDDILSERTADVDRAKDPKEIVNTLLTRGRLLRQLGHLAEANADFERAVEQCDAALPNGFEGGEIRELRARADLELGRHDAALADVGLGRDESGSVLKTPTQIRAEVHFDLRQLERAAHELEQAVRDAPQIGLLRSTLGAALAELGRSDEAMAEFGQAIAIEPTRPEHLYRRGWVMSMQGNYDEARKDLEEAVNFGESDPLALRRLAWFLATCPDMTFRDPDRAVSLAEKAAQIKPFNGAFWYTLGVCQYSRGDYEAARAACQRAVDMRDLPYSPLEEPRLATDYDRYAGFFLAMSLWQLGEKEKGREVYADAIAWRDQQAPDAEGRRRFRAEKQAMLSLAKQRPAVAEDQSGEQ